MKRTRSHCEKIRANMKKQWASGLRAPSEKSIAAAKANAKRFWSDPELIAKNIEGRKSKRFRDAHTTDHLQTKEMREKCTQAKRNSEAFKVSRIKAGKLLQSPEIRKRRLESWMQSPLAAKAVETMREALARSEKCQPGIKNHAARMWHIRSPDNVPYHFRNLAEFIRVNPHLFNPDDIPVKAIRGIGMLRPSDTRKRISGTWKGWTWISLIETFHNGENDLLSRANIKASELTPK
jgi:hypothetical protein